MADVVNSGGIAGAYGQQLGTLVDGAVGGSPDQPGGGGAASSPQTSGISNGLVVSKAVPQPSRQAEYILVWNKGHSPSGLTREFIRYVQDSLKGESSEGF